MCLVFSERKEDVYDHPAERGRVCLSCLVCSGDHITCMEEPPTANSCYWPFTRPCLCPETPQQPTTKLGFVVLGSPSNHSCLPVLPSLGSTSGGHLSSHRRSEGVSLAGCWCCSSPHGLAHLLAAAERAASRHAAPLSHTTSDG